MTSNRKVLVIGGGGYVGAVLVRRLLDRGFDVRVLDSFIYDNASSLDSLCDHPQFSLVVGDLRNAKDRTTSLAGVADVVLLASLVGDPIGKKYPDLMRAINLDASYALLNDMDRMGIDRLVFTSTCSNYGLRDTDDPADENALLKPLSLYAETKVAMENRLLSERNSWAFTPIILRIATAFGASPRMRFDLTVNEFTRTMANQDELVVYDKETWRPYCHVRDIAKAIILVLEANGDSFTGPDVFNVGGDENNYTKAMIVEEILKTVSGKYRFVDKGLDARNYKVSFKKIHSELGFVPDYSVSEYIVRLANAIRNGVYAGVDKNPEVFGNYRIIENGTTLPFK